jgi:hypothetical protein
MESSAADTRRNAAAHRPARQGHPVNTRIRETTINFIWPFSLKGVGRVLPAGVYRVVTDEELIESVSFPVYRRVSTMIFVPAASGNAIEMLTVDPAELKAAQARDAAQIRDKS